MSGKGGARLVHDEQFGMEHQGLGNFHHLLFRHREPAYQLVHPHGHLEFLKLFRLNSIADLPKFDESEIDRFELEGER